MVKVPVRHVIIKPSGAYFTPTRKMKAAGLHAEPLGKDLAKALARAEVLNADWDRIREGGQRAQPKVADGTLEWLVQRLKESSEWTDKGARTREEIGYALGVILPIFKTAPLADVTPDDCQDFYDGLRRSGSIHRAAKVYKWFRYLFSYAIRRGHLRSNPTLAVRIRKPKARTRAWEPTQVKAVVEAAREGGEPAIGLGIEILYDTSLRPGDVVTATWRRLDGESLWVEQGKTGALIRVPLWPETVAAIESYRLSLATVPLADSPILRGARGKRYTRYHFGRRAREIMRRAGLPEDLQIRDLRRTASKERAEAGATEAELAAGTGHSIEHGAKILDTYNPRSYGLAKSAQDKRRKNRK